ncbi:MAG: lipoyl(octanoyl) transferase LipB [Magnetococcus sp. DMHC-6]
MTSCVGYDRFWWSQLAYEAAWEAQKNRVADLLAGRVGQALFILEHPSVYTLGRSGSLADIRERGRIPVVVSDRGGKVTYHGPGQMVAYVIWDLRLRRHAVRQHVEMLERCVMETLADFGVSGEREVGNPGVWVAGAKIAALGVRIRQGVAYHGVAINRQPDMSHFQAIVPCGLPNREVTSLESLGVRVERAALEERFEAVFQGVFGTTT